MPRIHGHQVEAWQAYLFAVVATAAMLWFRMAIDGFLRGQPMLVMLTLPIMITAYVGGLRAGLLSTAMAFLGASYLLLAPAGSFDVASDVERFQLLFMTLAGVVICFVIESMHHSRRRAEGAVAEQREAQRAVRESEIRYHSLFETAPDGILIADSRSYYLDANAKACRMLGYAREELVGLHASDIVTAPELDQIGPTLQELGSQGRHRREWQFRCKDGVVFEAEVSATAMPDGTIMAMLRDVSERKEARRRLDEANLAAAAIAHELGVAEAADRAKSMFLATMSHELRTPLNSIIGFTSLVLQEMSGPVTKEQKKQLGMVKGSALHLLELINDVLDLSKIEAGQLQVFTEDFDLIASIQRTVESVRPMAEKKQLELIVELAPGVSRMASDRRRVEQILLNLLGNAIKFTDAGSVTLVAHAASDPAPHMRLEVRDTGSGIQPAELLQLFQPFRQVESGLARHSEGTGLGLAISRRLAKLLGGDIDAASEWQRGSVFTLTLPLHEVEPG